MAKKQNLLRTKPKTIAIFTGYYLPHQGGIEMYTNGLAHELQKLGYRIIIVTFNTNNSSNIENSNFKIYRLPVCDTLKKRYPLLKINQQNLGIMEKILNEDIDFIICNTRFYLTTFLGLKVAKHQKVPLTLIEHCSAHYSIGNNLLDFCGKIYEHFLTHIIKRRVTDFYGVSEASNRWLKHFNIDAQDTLYNAVNTDKESAKQNSSDNSQDKTLITYVGRIIPQKGVEELIKAYLGTMDAFPKTELLIIGDGAIRKNLEKQYSSAQIKFFGELPNAEVLKLLKSTDIFVYPSQYPEGLPTAILEAGLMQCAVIATDRGGTTELITNENYGIIVQPDARSIESALRNLLSSPKKVLKLKKNLHNRVIKKFTWRQTATKVAKIIEKITS